MNAQVAAETKNWKWGRFVTRQLQKKTSPEKGKMISISKLAMILALEVIYEVQLQRNFGFENNAKANQK